MSKKINTISLQGKEYAQVKDRIKEFRKDNPRGLIETNPTIQPDGQIIFKARILKDKEDQNSAEATGHAIGKNAGVKAFEKLETIAVGRALGLLGYASDGEIASSEEMEEFESYKEEKREARIQELTELIENTKTLKELQEVWASVDGGLKKELEKLKDTKKEMLK